MRLVLFLMLIISTSCSHKTTMDEKELYKFIRNEHNGLIKSKETEGFHLAMVWKPNDLIARQQAIKGTKREYDSLTKYFSNHLYFTLEMSYDGKDLETKFGSDLASFPDKISFLSSGLSQNVQLKSKQDTLSPMECIYNRSYGIGISQCLIVFEKPKDNQFEVEVKGYPIGFGKQTFQFNLSDIENAPRLNTTFL